ncbi:hypothetical protein BDV98DRAFT_659658 [Pterulicium gracile]|uniref:Uncharacterized protein n=1 Tax=Pterulicium gracile TaxID=1884261 RepID=A0A5C3QAT3_9AGAR|nr:hypothetical protein BDV98DRAFT_659658 [Pterula gracilis]
MACLHAPTLVYNTLLVYTRRVHKTKYVPHSCARRAAEIDARCACLPPNHNIRFFLKGITSLQQLTGQEHDQIPRFLLRILVNLPLPGRESPSRLIRALRALLDFLLLAKLPIHSTTSIQRLQKACQRFHDNEDIFVDLGIRSNFRLPKLHALNHYPASIRYFGSLDNFDTQYTERLHIDMAKDAYCASNHKEEYPQKTSPCRTLTMTKYSSVRVVSLATLMDTALDHRAPMFDIAFRCFALEHLRPELIRRRGALEENAEWLTISFDRVSTYHRIKFRSIDYTQKTSTVDCILVWPRRFDRYKQVIPARFDTALVYVNDASRELSYLTDTRVAQVRVVFKLPNAAYNSLLGQLPEAERPGPFVAYVEWFSPFPTTSHPDHGMYHVKCSLADRGCSRLCSVINLIPRFPAGGIPDGWTSSNVLDKYNDFWFGEFTDDHQYRSLM